MEEQHDEEQHGYLLSGLDFLFFFLPLIVTVLIAYTDSLIRNEKIHMTTDKGSYVYTRIFFDFGKFYFVYIIIAVAALLGFFKGKSRRAKGIATCAFIGNLLLAGGIGFLYWAFQDMGKYD